MRIAEDRSLWMHSNVVEEYHKLEYKDPMVKEALGNFLEV